MTVLSTDLVCKCPNFKRLKSEFGSYRWNPFSNKDNTEGSLINNDPVTTDSYIDEIEANYNLLSNADSFLKKDESIVCPHGNMGLSENVKRKLASSKAILSIVQMNLPVQSMRRKT